MAHLICGLGNIGGEYAFTRHNIGFMILDKLALDCNATWDYDKYVTKTAIKVKGRNILLIKPTTYMNLSGKAYRYWVQKSKTHIENALVITDDLSLPFGMRRLKLKGSAGSHNGLGNIEMEMNSASYPRLRVGIGDDFSRGKQVDFVLSEFSKEEQKTLPLVIDKVKEMALSFVLQGPGLTMTNFNGS